LRDSSVNWAVTGSLALALQGVPVEVHDVDPLTDEAGAYEIERRLFEFVTCRVRFSAEEHIRSHFGALTIDGVKVEIIGDVETRRADESWEGGWDLARYKRVVEIEGMHIPVLSLECEYEAYRRLGRTEKMELLREWLYGKRGFGEMLERWNVTTWLVEGRMVDKVSQLRVDVLEYYATPGEVTDPGQHARCLDVLPSEIPALSEIMQGLLIHVLEAERYGVQLSRERSEEVRIGCVTGMLSRILELDRRPLTVARPPERRLVATCHDYAVLLAAILRQQGRPARPRAGFAAYLAPGRYTDHWVCECWRPAEQRWARVDVQLDSVQRKAYDITFDPCDVPGDHYLAGAEAWQLCRAGDMDPDRFGFSRWWGWGYLRHSLLRDLLALNKVEILPWESAGLPEKEEAKVSQQDRATLDRIAALTLEGNGAFPALREAYERVMRLGSPPDWQPWRLEEVDGGWWMAVSGVELAVGGQE